ncbi:MAG: phosphoglycerate mutase family protein [Gemmatimonadales bacterium]
MRSPFLAVAICAALFTITTPSAAQQATTVILVRHAEKESTAGERDPVLSAAGKARARELARVLAQTKISTIYSTPFHRTMNTAQPIAELLGLEVTTTPVSGTLVQDMARLLREDHAGETVLVVSHSNTVPAIMNALGAGPYEQLGEDEYDDLFVVTLSADGSASAVQLKYGKETP